MGQVKAWRRLGAWGIVLLTSTATTGCSLIDPYVQPSTATTQKFADDRSLTNATIYAEELAGEYKGAISDQAILNSSVGLALIPVSAIAAYYGITGGHGNTILGLGLGGAGAYLGANYLHSEPRQFVYAAGVTALSCAVNVMEPMRAAHAALRVNKEDNGALTKRLEELSLAIQYAELILPTYANRLGTADEAVLKAQEAIDRAKALTAEGAQVDALLKTSGGTLFNAVQQIEALVTKAIIDTEPNLSALVSSLGSALPLRAGQIAPQPVAKTPAGETKVANSGGRDPAIDRQELAGELQKLEKAAFQVREITTLVQSKSPVEALNNCGADISKAGLTFAVIPNTPVTFANNTIAETVTLSVRGGMPPYGVNWAGPTPADITVKLDPSPSWDGTGVLTITETTKAAAKNRYSLLIYDAGVGTMILEVNAANSTTTSDAGGGTGTTNSAFKTLKELGCIASNQAPPATEAETMTVVDGGAKKWLKEHKGGAVMSIPDLILELAKPDNAGKKCTS